MTQSSRREFIKTAAVASFATASGAAAPFAAAEEKTMGAPAFGAQHAPVPLPFDPKSLHGLSDRLIQSHWENNYGGAVKALNALRARLALALGDPDTPPYVYTGLKREQLLRTGSVVLHEAYFANLGGSGKPDAEVRTKIAGSFGTFDAWESEFRKIGLGLGGGSGWVVLGFNRRLKLLENYWMADHATRAVDTSRCSSWTCMSTPTRWTLARRPPSTSMRSSPASTGRRSRLG